MPNALKSQNSKRQGLEYGKFLLVEKALTKKVGDLMAPHIHLKEAQNSVFLYVREGEWVGQEVGSKEEFCSQSGLDHLHHPPPLI